MPFSYIAEELWRWVAGTGINLALILALALLIPRAGRFANRVVERQVQNSESDDGKTRLAIAGVGINIVQILAFFLIFVYFLQQLGFSLAGAAIPATVVSAAIGFGAQKIIADFLAGFFILTEKQYGVGDFVTFSGNGVEISGDVIQITMRSTQIRTLEQATVSIPNSTARICINQSNYWSSAVVVMPVPLLGSASADEAIERSENAAQRALSTPDVAEKVLGELSVHPAVDVNPPTSVGMPWTVDIRFIVRVEPLSQWMVERAVRVALLNEFWDEYGSATAIDGSRLDHVITHPRHTEMMPAASDSRERSDEQDTRVLPAARAETGSEAGLSIDAEDDPATDTLAQGTGDNEEDTGSAPARTVLHGTMRLSTAVLLAVFAVLLIIRGLTLDASTATSNNSGVLAPPPRETETPVPVSTSTPAPVAPTAPATGVTPTAETATGSGSPASRPTAAESSPAASSLAATEPSPTTGASAQVAPGAPSSVNAPPTQATATR
ncbi:putative MscS family protein YkuT [Corynebacterium capitovis DSM 44611]|uniref:mechanosensitive ion channel family protein n=1 Tax=Corynebacterium capitovis TaxID=131081 RepID=UPI00035D3715|nr:mechanosensitive ion channel family protein [Corynebacterium capitovis]WKD57802.1 putative MscS family protein YkuT [Corynebacterium capitovis DSM 44611]